MPQSCARHNWPFILKGLITDMTAQDDGKMNDFSPFQQITEQRTGRWLITCDHATNRIPNDIQADLGLLHADLSRHIAYDIGARGFSLELARLLNSPVLLSDFSRLVIDPNRGEADPTLVMQLYDGTIIPANRSIDAAEIARRLDVYYRPYHEAYETLASRRDDVAICAIHSFTPQLKARPRRPWQIGILSHYDKRLSAPLIKALEASKALQAEAEKHGERLTIGDNEPYIGHFPGDAIDTHAIKHGRLNVLIELRSDLIETADDQCRWAGLLAPILAQTLKDTGL